ncbi:hypothetical protein ACIHFD_04500 [Nonomuraea sp. NPDC051941]|uniref:hypothetical protein n=1 Tax=Nonomuraea sp. NPDC051941 TaxID=3364373 RepID=UPI0037CAF1C6
MTAIALVISLLVGGCAQQSEEVDPGVLEEVNKIGTVIWEGRKEGLMGSEAVVTHAFLVDVGGDTEEESLGKAVAYLQGRNWTTKLDSRPQNVWLKSSRWKGATIAAYAWSVSEEHDQPEAMKAIESQGIKPTALVSVYAYVGW